MPDRTDTTNRVFVVTDATPTSTFGDIAFSADPVRLCDIMVGAGGRAVVAREHWTFYSNARAAAEAAYERMTEAGAIVTRSPADLTRLSVTDRLNGGEEIHRRAIDAALNEGDGSYKP